MGVGDTGTFHHTCFVVHDVVRAARSLAETLGIGPWAVFDLEPATATLRGEPARFSFRVALAQVGDGSYELLMPLEGESVYEEHLRDRGEGVHHTCIAYPTVEAMRQARADLSSQGRQMIQSGEFGELAEFCYFEIEETGSILELLYLDMDQMPPPTMIIE
jgi:hypothetical protein